MFTTLWRYFYKEAWPRRAEILSGGELWVAVGLGVLTGILAPQLASDTRLGDALTVVLAYAAIAFGFSVAGLTVALTLPDAAFVHQLATAEPRGAKLRNRRRKPNAYGDLLFVYSWTAMLHWLVIVLSFGLLLSLGYDHRLGGKSIGALTREMDGLLVFLLAYAAIQFLITLVTLSQVGRRYIDSLKKREESGT